MSVNLFANESLPLHFSFVPRHRPPEVSFTLTNDCQNLSHLVIYDYKKWLETEEEDTATLFVLDASVDNMFSALKSFKMADNSGLYLVRAYFDYSNELEKIVYIPSNDAIFNLYIQKKGHSFSTRAPAQFITASVADEILRRA